LDTGKDSICGNAIIAKGRCLYDSAGGTCSLVDGLLRNSGLPDAVSYSAGLRHIPHNGSANSDAEGPYACGCDSEYDNYHFYQVSWISTGASHSINAGTCTCGSRDACHLYQGYP
jgi:hypothetical protein